MIRPFLIILLLLSFKGVGQDLFILTDPGEGSILLDSGWTYRMSPDTNYQVVISEPFSLNQIRPSLDINSMPSELTVGVGYLQLRFRVSLEIRKQKVAFSIQQSVASEIYLNGHLVERFGTVSTKPGMVRAFDPMWQPVPIDFSEDSIQSLLVRFSIQPNIKHTTLYGTRNPLFSLEVMRYNRAVQVFKK